MLLYYVMEGCITNGEFVGLVALAIGSGALIGFIYKTYFDKRKEKETPQITQ